jgi:hypothetical protein
VRDRGISHRSIEFPPADTWRVAGDWRDWLRDRLFDDPHVPEISAVNSSRYFLAPLALLVLLGNPSGFTQTTSAGPSGPPGGDALLRFARVVSDSLNHPGEIICGEVATDILQAIPDLSFQLGLPFVVHNCSWLC